MVGAPRHSREINFENDLQKTPKPSRDMAGIKPYYRAMKELQPLSIKHKFDGTVASSVGTAERLKSHNIPVYELNAVNQVAVYVDGADETNARLDLSKGGGGALTREKIVAAASALGGLVLGSMRERSLSVWPGVLAQIVGGVLCAAFWFWTQSRF